jgi:hypothetical protein
MNRPAIGLAAVSLLVLSVAPALAATKKIRWTQIVGTASEPAAGACTEAGYANQCPGGQCDCVEVLDATVSNVSRKPSLAGTGKANLFLTFDNGAEMPSHVGDCTPFLGIAQLNTTSRGKPVTETLNLVGVNCDALETSPNQPVLGGFGVAQKPAPSPGSKGFGEIRGFLNGRNTGGPVSFTLHGPITQ